MVEWAPADLQYAREEGYVDVREIMNEKQCFVLDMDGTFYLGSRILEGSLDFISELTRRGKQFIFFTNNSSKNSRAYVDKLARMGCRVTESQVVTSGDVTACYLQRHYPDSSVYLVGTAVLKADFRQRGIKLVDQNPDIVVVAFDTGLTYDDLSQACRFIREGSLFLATHPDLNCPTEDGFIPDCGAVCACITASTQVTPKYLGKPNRETVDYLLDHLQCAPEELVLIGDRLYTEIAMGVMHGIDTVLVLSGETTLSDLKESKVQPACTVGSLVDMIR